MATKAERQARVMEIVRGTPVGSQNDLVRRLRKAGVGGAQASISRDIRELGLVKHDGRYVLPGDDTGHLERREEAVGAFIQSVEPVGPNLVVVRMLPGTAHSLAVYLDHGGWPGIAGTVAGDDTIFVAVRSTAGGRKIARRIRKLMEK